jgi:hypothetical protein
MEVTGVGVESPCTQRLKYIRRLQAQDVIGPEVAIGLSNAALEMRMRGTTTTTTTPASASSAAAVGTGDGTGDGSSGGAGGSASGSGNVFDGPFVRSHVTNGIQEHFRPPSSLSVSLCATSVVSAGGQRIPHPNAARLVMNPISLPVEKRDDRASEIVKLGTERGALTMHAPFFTTAAPMTHAIITPPHLPFEDVLLSSLRGGGGAFWSVDLDLANGRIVDVDMCWPDPGSSMRDFCRVALVRSIKGSSVAIEHDDAADNDDDDSQGIQSAEVTLDYRLVQNPADDPDAVLPDNDDDENLGCLSTVIYWVVHVATAPPDELRDVAALTNAARAQYVRTHVVSLENAIKFASTASSFVLMPSICTRLLEQHGGGAAAMDYVEDLLAESDVSHEMSIVPDLRAHDQDADIAFSDDDECAEFKNALLPGAFRSEPSARVRIGMAGLSVVSVSTIASVLMPDTSVRQLSVSPSVAAVITTQPSPSVRDEAPSSGEMQIDSADGLAYTRGSFLQVRFHNKQTFLSAHMHSTLIFSCLFRLASFGSNTAVPRSGILPSLRQRQKHHSRARRKADKADKAARSTTKRQQTARTGS